MGGRGGVSHRRGFRTFGRDPNPRGFLRFGSQREAIDYHIQNNYSSDRWHNLLTGDERDGVVKYTSYHYSAINTALRERRTPSPEVQKMIDGATAGLAKWSAQDNVITYRGANLHWTANLLQGTELQMSNAAFLKSRIGMTVQDLGFMSSGTHINSAWTADVTYKIYVNKGIKGMYVDPISANRGEYEFLFNRDTHFVIHQIKTNGNGRIKELVIEAVSSDH